MIRAYHKIEGDTKQEHDWNIPTGKYMLQKLNPALDSVSMRARVARNVKGWNLPPSMTKEEKVRIGKALEKMRVDVMEAGFAAASPGDFAAIEAVASSVRESTVCSLARAVDRDIEQAAAALKNAERARIHTFIATSPIHMQYKLRMEPNAVIEQAVRAVKKARGLVEDVENWPWSTYHKFVREGFYQHRILNNYDGDFGEDFTRE